MALFPIYLTLVLSQGSPPPSVWQVHANPTNFGSVPIHGTSPTESVEGYKFTVAARPDGSLPLLKFDLDLSASTTLFKKLPSGSYALYCAWSFKYLEGDGLLLQPGEYLFKSTSTGPLFEGSALLGGYWATSAQQSSYFEVVGSQTAFSDITLLAGGTAKGLRFLLKTRADAKKPVATQLTTVLTSNADLRIYRRETRTLFSIYAAWRVSTESSHRGIRLEIGEYYVDIRNTPYPAEYFEHARLLTGHYE